MGSPLTIDVSGLVGSAMEGTKIGPLNEAVCNIFFTNLKPEFFALSNCATNYRVTEAGRQVLNPHFVGSKGFLNYFSFQETLLTELARFFATQSLPKGMTVQQKSSPMCNDCGKEKGAFGHLKHCKNCLPAVTFSKSGPRGILNDNGTIVSIDLIPLMPCPEKTPIVMFDKVAPCLVSGNLPNWLPYLKTFIKSDTLLPAAVASLTDTKDGFIAMNLLHALSNEDMFILRPSHTLVMEELQDPKFKKTYGFLESLKNVIIAASTKSNARISRLK